MAVFLSDVLDPITSAESWDSVLVAGIISPGVCKVTGFKRAFGWEIKKGKGAKGSTVTLNEYPPAEGSITFTLWTQEHFEQWREFRDIWNYDPTKKPVNAVDIYYPSLADVGIDRVVCKSVSAIEAKGKGLYEATVELIEYNPPPKKPAVATPKSSEPIERAVYQNPKAENTNESMIDKLKKLAGDPFGTG